MYMQSLQTPKEREKETGEKAEKQKHVRNRRDSMHVKNNNNNNNKPPKGGERWNSSSFNSFRCISKYFPRFFTAFPFPVWDSVYLPEENHQQRVYSATSWTLLNVYTTFIAVVLITAHKARSTHSFTQQVCVHLHSFCLICVCLVFL